MNNVEDYMYTLEDLCVVIVFYNGEKSLVDRVKTLSCYVKDILVVDNNSDSETLGIIQQIALIPYVTVLRNEQNMGIAYALNQGLKHAVESKKALLLTLDQDSQIGIETIIRLVGCINIPRKVISVGPFYSEKNNKNKETVDVTYLITSGNVIHVNKCVELGGYNDKLFIDCVDIDLSFKIFTHGYRMQKISKAFLNHRIGEYEKSSLLRISYLAHSPKRYFYIYRNNIYIYKTFFSKLPWECVKLFLSLLLGTLKLILVEKSKVYKIRYACNGICAGIKNDFSQPKTIESRKSK